MVRWGALGGLGVLFLVSPLTSLITRKVLQLRKKLIVITDERVKWISEIIKGMKVLKFYAYEDAFIQKITKIRENELKSLRVLEFLKESNMAIAFSTPVFMSLATFLIYSIDHEVTSQVAFTVLALFANLRVAIKFIPTVSFIFFFTYS
jgi:ATP-binding cassette subfamily C (CFTR/MRP) protein 1